MFRVPSHQRPDKPSDIRAGTWIVSSIYDAGPHLCKMTFPAGQPGLRVMPDRLSVWFRTRQVRFCGELSRRRSKRRPAVNPVYPKLPVRIAPLAQVKLRHKVVKFGARSFSRALRIALPCSLRINTDTIRPGTFGATRIIAPSPRATPAWPRSGFSKIGERSARRCGFAAASCVPPCLPPQTREFAPFVRR